MSSNLVARELFSFYDVVFPWFFFQCLKMYTSAFVFEVGYPSLIKVVCVVLTSTGWLLETFLLYSRRWRYSSSCGLSLWRCLSRAWECVPGAGSRFAEGVGLASETLGPVRVSVSGAVPGVHEQTSRWRAKADGTECIPLMPFKIFYLLPFLSSSFPSNQWGPFLQFCMLLERHRSLHNCDI